MANDDKKARDKEITDILLDDFDKFEHFAMTKWKQIFAVCIIIVVVVAIVATGYSIHTAAERKANNAIANAKTAEELEKVIKEYPAKKATWSAYSKLATLYIAKKDYDKAQDAYQVLLKNDLPEEMRWQLTMNCAYLTELGGDKKGAVVKFAKIGSDSFFPEAMQVEANYCAGRLAAEVGNKPAAKNYLNLALSKVKQGGAVNPAIPFWQKQARVLIQQLDQPKKKAVKKSAKKTAKKVTAKKTVAKK